MLPFSNAGSAALLGNGLDAGNYGDIVFYSPASLSSAPSRLFGPRFSRDIAYNVDGDVNFSVSDMWSASSGADGGRHSHGADDSGPGHSDSN